MDQRPKCKARHYKTFKGKYRTLSDINHSKIFFAPYPRVMKIKDENK